MCVHRLFFNFHIFYLNLKDVFIFLIHDPYEDKEHKLYNL